MGFKLHKDTNPFLLGALASAVLVPWVGFDVLGWKTGGVAESAAQRRVDGAVVAVQARICSAQFGGAKNLPARLAELQKTERYSRGEVVTKAGFSMMPGEKEPTQGVAQACAELLVPEKN